MSASTATDEEKAYALALYTEHGPAEASRRTGINESTIKSWARRAGVQRDSDAKTFAATEAARLKREEKREKLRVELLDKALDLLARMDERHKDFRGKDASEVWWDKAPADACKAYATAAAILVDKFRLEVGDATARTETLTMDAITARIEQLRAKLGESDN